VIGSTVDQRWCRHESRECSGSPALAGDDEEGEAEPEGCSPEHEWRWRGGATAVGSFSSRRC
jgi:hypothetical protein